MLDLLRPRHGRRKCDGTSRRDFLRIGALGVAGWTLADLLRWQAASAAVGDGRPQRKRAVILLFLDGGASQHETFDPKLECPVEYRSLFGSVPTSIPGVHFGAQLPQMAALADRMSIVRTLAHEDGDHGGATHWMKTGYSWPEQFKGQAPVIPQQNPSLGSIAARYFGPTNAQGMPTYVRVLSNHGGYPGDDAAWLGAAHAPLRVRSGRGSELLDSMSLRIEPERLGDRRALLTALDRLDRRLDQSGVMQGMDDFHQQATNVVLGAARSAFDLEQEPAALRDKYGPGLGQELLLARRLCEAGCGFVTLNNGYWDHHGGIIPGLKELTPPLDRAVAAYIDDVTARGLLDDICLVITGEFGRTPRINGGPGRDHWAPTNCAVFIGGGLRMGQVIGETDSRAAYPIARPVSVQDYMATVFHVLGIDPRVQFLSPSGRPTYMIEHGSACPELV